MLGPEQADTLEKLDRTRRNVLAIGTVLAGALLSGCKANQTIIERFEDIEANKRPHHTKASVTSVPNCYLRGTRILTPGGERPIEDLEIGDLVCDAQGGSQPVRWIGWRRYNKAAHERWLPELVPIRIRAGALGSARPHADLLVSPEHRLYFGGVLVRATELVNDNTVVAENSFNELLYLHVLTNKHSLMLCEGIPTETLLYDPKTINQFDNYAEFEALYGMPTGAPEHPCAAVYADTGRRARIGSHLRNAISPLIDRRTPRDIVRDRLMCGKLVRGHPT